MFKAIKEFFLGKPAAEKTTQEAPYKVETPVALGEPPATVVVPVEGAGAVSWHTAPPEGTKPVEIKDVLDVNHDGKVNLDDIKEVVKKTRAKKPAAEKAAKPKKPAAPVAKKPGRKPKAK